MSYPKIHTLWKRNEKGVIIPGEYSKPEFEAIKLWSVSEKINGMNIKICPDQGNNNYSIFICGRHSSKTAEIPEDLTKFIKETLTSEKITKAFGDKKITLYGEGYGHDIHQGSHYNTFGRLHNFALFDVVVNGYWLNPYNIYSVATKLDLILAPQLRLQKIDEIVASVEKAPMSNLENGSLVAEGIVARSYPLMFFNDGTPIMFKLKVKDYIKLDNG